MTDVRRKLGVCALLFILSAPVFPAGYQGKVVDATSGQPLPSAIVNFLRQNGLIQGRALTNSLGAYKVPLPPGRYLITASHVGYETYASAPAFITVAPNSYGTGDLRLKKYPRLSVTTVLLIRHADRDGTNDQLSAAGRLRAEELVHVAEKAGIGAIFATDAQRSQETVAPLATKLGLTPIIYSVTAYTGLANQIRSQYAGEAVLVAGHSNTIAGIVGALQGDSTRCPVSEPEFDNLCVLTLSGQSTTTVVNLQYGAMSP